MQVFKFGGASVKDADSIRNVADVIAKYKKDELLVVVSALGKTTNALTEVTNHFVEQTGQAFDLLEKVKAAHQQILNELFGVSHHPIFDETANCFVEIEWILEEEPQDSYDYLHDQIVSTGELVSSKILAAYCSETGLPITWIDARDYIFTDNTYQEAAVDWQKTEDKIRRELPAILDEHIIVTQGFIGSTSENFTTTLGREGSDYSAAIFAPFLHAEDVNIRQDVQGVLIADPKWLNHTELIPKV